MAEKTKFEDIIDELKQKTAGFDASNYLGFLAIQITLKDLKKVFYIEVRDGKLSIEPYEYNDRHANIIMSSANFIKMINGKLNKELAFATGKLKIEGDIGRASELSNLFAKK
ncbi:MAG: SCP2 sterol-binding domain-containing protein [Oscillospiraceae bacterium]|nr:SCP2 sterol-binding domain-containing protein [Oscillospiraceae bacterium]